MDLSTPGTGGGYSSGSYYATYVISRSGTTYTARNSFTGNTDYSGTDLATVLQDTINASITAYGEAVLYFQPNQTYVITLATLGHSISHASGCVFLYSDGAYMDLTTPDGDVFDFGDDAAALLTGITAHRTGMQGFTCLGTNTNASTKILTVRNCGREVIFRDMLFSKVNNILEIRGNCYSALVENCRGEYVRGTAIKITYTATGGQANNAVISHLEISNSTSAVYDSSIAIDMTGATALDGVHVHDCWLEKFNTGIKVDGRYHLIHDNFLSCSQGAAAKNINLQGDSNYITIRNNLIYCATATYGVYHASSNYFHSFEGNFFYIPGTGVGIYSTAAILGAIVGNVARCDGAGGLVSAVMTNCSITGNKIYGDNSTTVGFAGSGSGNMVSGNAVSRCAVGWDDTGFTTTNIIGNNFAGCTTDIDDLDATSLEAHNMT
jgi:hypothetical protein